MTVGLYAKAVSAAVVTGLTAAITALDDGVITGYEWTVIAAAFLAAAGAVWAVPNIPDGARVYGKAVTAAVIAGLGAAGAAMIGDGAISPDEWLTVIVALAGGAGLTYTVPNSDRSDLLTRA